MQLITDEMIKLLSIRSGVEALEKDLELITQFVKHANGAGLESLDTPTGKLIESGLTDRYPDHFTPGAGLEGLSGLIATLKKGIDGLKKLGRGKAKATIEKTAAPVEAEIKNTYANNNWWGGKKIKETPPITNSLSKLIGDFSDFSSLKSALTAAQKTMSDVYVANTKQTEAYGDLVDKVVTDIQKLKGKSQEELTAFANEKMAMLKTHLDAIKSDLPEIKPGASSELPPLTAEHGKSLGELMKEIMSWGVDIEMDAEDNRITYGAGQDTFDNVDGADDNDAMSKLQWNFLYWESATEANSALADKIYKWSLQVAQQLESVINSAVK